MKRPMMLALGAIAVAAAVAVTVVLLTSSGEHGLGRYLRPAARFAPPIAGRRAGGGDPDFQVNYVGDRGPVHDRGVIPYPYQANPVISGTAVQGNTLTAAPGSFVYAYTAAAYQWQHCASGTCTNISGATASTYVQSANDVGDSIRVLVTETSPRGGTATRHSFPTATVTASGGGGSTTTSTSTTTTATGTTTTSGGGCTPAAFPSVLHTSGQVIDDASNCQLAAMKGFSIQIGPWGQSTYNALAAKGAKFTRLVTFWNDYQGSDCNSLSATNASTYVADVDSAVAEAQSAGIYTELDIHLNVGQVPSCASAGSSETSKFLQYGQWITQYLANRYGNPSSPEYTKDVVGFGLNEPPPEDGVSTSQTDPSLEAAQRTVLTWVRGTGGSGGAAPQWIGFVAYAYGNWAPLFDTYSDSGSHACSSCVAASTTAYNSVGANVILDFHDYAQGCISSSWMSDSGDSNVSDCDSRQQDGAPNPTFNGGPGLQTGNSSYPTYPASGETQTQAQAQLANYAKPYIQFAANANIPLDVGEIGWAASVNSTGAASYANDLESSLASASPAIQLEWDYDTNQGHDPWAANPGTGASGQINSDGWQVFTDTFF